MYSVSKFHFVAIVVPLLDVGIPAHLLNRISCRARIAPWSDGRVHIRLLVVARRGRDAFSRGPQSAPAPHDSGGGRGGRGRGLRMVRDMGLLRPHDDAHGPVDDRFYESRLVLRIDQRDDGRDDAAVGVAHGHRIPRPHPAGTRPPGEARRSLGDRRVRRAILPRMGILRSRGAVHLDDLGADRIHADGAGPASIRRNPARRGSVAGHADERSVPRALRFPDGLRDATLAQRSDRCDADGLPSFPVLHRLLLALHARPVHLRIDEPAVDGRPIGRHLRGETRRPDTVFLPSDWDYPCRTRRLRGCGRADDPVMQDGDPAAYATDSGISRIRRTDENKTKRNENAPPMRPVMIALRTPIRSPRTPPVKAPRGNVPQTIVRIVAFSRPCKRTGTMACRKLT